MSQRSWEDSAYSVMPSPPFSEGWRDDEKGYEDTRVDGMNPLLIMTELKALTRRFVEVMVKLDPTLSIIHQIDTAYHSDVFRYSLEDAHNAYTDVHTIHRQVKALCDVLKKTASKQPWNPTVYQDVKNQLDFLVYAGGWWLKSRAVPGKALVWDLPVTHVRNPFCYFQKHLLEKPLMTSADCLEYQTRLLLFPIRIRQLVEVLRSDIRKGISLPRFSIRSLLLQIQAQFSPYVRQALFRNVEALRIYGDPCLFEKAVMEHWFPAVIEFERFVRLEMMLNPRVYDGIYGLRNYEEEYLMGVYRYTGLCVTVDVIRKMGEDTFQELQDQLFLVKNMLGYSSLCTRDFLVGFVRGVIHPIRRLGMMEWQENLLECMDVALMWVGKGGRSVLRHTYRREDLDAEMSTVLRRIQWKAVTMGHIATMALGLSMDSTSVRDATVIEKIVRDEMDLTWFSAYAEYAGVGLQMYTYHMDYIGWIMRDLFRTVSLMVDIRLHIHGASIEECVQFMSQHVPWFCVDEVRGFVGMWSVCPGLAVAPKLGEWKMRELTREALRRYPCHVGELHGEVFLEREMPIGVVEKRVEEWMARRQARLDKNAADAREREDEDDEEEEDEEDEDDEEDEEDVDEEEDLENEEEPILVKD